MIPNLDNQVLEDFQKGKHSAFQTVFEYYYPRLFDFANRLIESSDEAEDIVIVVFHRLFVISSQFSNEANVRAFLYLCVRNKCFSYLKSRKVKSDYQKMMVERTRNDVLMSYEYEIRDLLYTKVQTAIDNLPEECRKIFKMLFLQDLKPQEVAEILQISTSTVYNQKQNALKALRLALGENSLFLTLFIHILVASNEDQFRHISV